jgi:deoxyribodipyrimidine photo-lyase
MQSAIGASRLRPVFDRPPNRGARYILYWMRAYQRSSFNHSLQRAIELANHLELPLVVLEKLCLEQPWCSARSHRFALDGMIDNARAFSAHDVVHYRFVEQCPGEADGLLEALSSEAAVVIGDDAPHAPLRHHLDGSCRFELVDSNGVYPSRCPTKVFATAHGFRRAFQRFFPEAVDDGPSAEPLDDLAPLPMAAIDPGILARWPISPLADLNRLHDVAPPPEPISTQGGEQAARERLHAFVHQHLTNYHIAAQHPDDDACSQLSPFLRFGQISSHEILWTVLQREDWNPSRLAATCRGQREGWWGIGAGPEAFLDQTVIWRELGFIHAALLPTVWDQYASLPEWAQRTLAKHATDPRPAQYEIERLRRAESDDPLWNAAQRQLRSEGRIHNALRMLWGKRILGWISDPKRAFEVMVELNNRYAIDGCDPNSATGILWCMGKFDRPWGPERPVFGTVRYMSSASTAKKRRVKAYLQRHAG